MSPSQLELLLCWRQIEPREEIARLLLQPGKDEVIKGKPTRRLLRERRFPLFFLFDFMDRDDEERSKGRFQCGLKRASISRTTPKATTSNPPVSTTRRHRLQQAQRLLDIFIQIDRILKTDKKRKHNSCGHGQWLTYQPSRIRDGLVDSSSSSTEPKWGNWRAIDGRWPVYIEDQTAHITARRRED